MESKTVQDGPCKSLLDLLLGGRKTGIPWKSKIALKARPSRCSG